MQKKRGKAEGKRREACNSVAEVDPKIRIAGIEAERKGPLRAKKFVGSD